VRIETLLPAERLEKAGETVRRRGRSQAFEHAERGLRRSESRGPRTEEFPGKREICIELIAFRPILGKTGQKSPMIRAGSAKIPYSTEQGIFSAEQGIQIPCSAESRDISRLTRRPSGRFRAQAPGKTEESKSRKALRSHFMAQADGPSPTMLARKQRASKDACWPRAPFETPAPQ
jgi:hypothetical protein